MVVCKNCGKENQPHYKFCLYCGSEIQGEADVTLPQGEAPPHAPQGEADNPDTPLPPPRPPSVYFTGEPRMPLNLEALSPLGPGTATGTRPPAEMIGGKAEPATTLRPDSPSRMCPTCKALVPIGFQFCGQCGGRVDLPRRAQSAAAASGRLLLIRPDGSEGGWHPLSQGVNLVGRGSGPLFDADSYLSPLHLQVELLDTGQFTLRDAGSLNGVFVKLTEEEAVSDGAVFRLGQELLRFDTIRPPRPLEDGTEVMGSPNPGYWGRIAIIIGRAQDGSCFPLFGDAVVLGRERGDILFAEDGYVSGTHARISYRHGQVYLQDLASSNGTFLKVRGERTVRTGAYVLMGQQLFRLVS